MSENTRHRILASICDCPGYRACATVQAVGMVDLPLHIDPKFFYTHEFQWMNIEGYYILGHMKIKHFDKSLQSRSSKSCVQELREV
jgi:hypothetical protein